MKLVSFCLLSLLLLVHPATSQTASDKPPLEVITFDNADRIVDLQDVGWTDINAAISSVDDRFIAENVLFAPDGNIVAIGDWTSVYLWDIGKGELLHLLEGHNQSVISLAFSSDGRLLATGAGGRPSRDNTIRLWNVLTGQLITVLEGHNDGVYDLEFSLDNTKLYSVSGDWTLREWDLSTGENKILVQDAFPDRLLSLETLDLSPDGKQIAFGGYEGLIRTLDLSSGEITVLLDTSVLIFDVHYLSDGQTLIATSLNVHLLDSNTGEQLGQFPMPDDYYTASSYATVSHDGSTLITIFNKRMIFQHLATGRQVQRIAFGEKNGVLFQQTIRNMDVNPDGTMITLALLDGGVRLWGVPSNQ